jgi:hypothetical protein
VILPPAARIFVSEFAARHRLGFGVVAIYIALLVARRLVAPMTDLDEGQFVGMTPLPLSTAAFYMLAVFSFGFAGDVAARQSMYPSRLFVLPVTTTALTFWPMLFGTASVAVLGLAAQIAPWPEGIHPPPWTILLVVVVLAWIQALTWMPYPLRGLRIAAAVGVLTVMDVGLVVAIELKWPAAVVAAGLVPLLPLAYLTAYAAVARARRGDEPDWSHAAAAEAPTSVPALGRGFISAMDAQTWSEWQAYGWSLPAWVAILTTIGSAALFADAGYERLLWIKLEVILAAPPIMASFVTASVSRGRAAVADDYGLPPFLATRPLASAALVTAKLRAAAWSTLAAWALVIVIVPIALFLSGNWSTVADRVLRLRDVIGTFRTAIFLLLVLALLAGLTWKRLVLSMHIGLRGRPWLVRLHFGITVVFLIGLMIVVGPLNRTLRDHVDWQIAAWKALPWMMGALVVAKLALAGWMFARLQRERLLTDRAIIARAAWWSVAVFALYGVLSWMASTPHVSRHLLMLFAILVTPLARLSAAPLALAWNRHR